MAGEKLMGRQHRERVFEIPAGHVTADERLVLVVLADVTHDGRLEWAHDREVIMPMMGLDPDRDSDHEWLRRRFKDLEDAGYIVRRDQRRGDLGTWHRVSIKLEIGADQLSIDISEMASSGMIRPTSRASRGDRRSRNLPDTTDRERDEHGRFMPAHSDGGTEPHANGGPEPHAVGGDHPTQTVELDRTTGLIQDNHRTVDDDESAEKSDPAHHKREAKDALQSIGDILDEGDVLPPQSRHEHG